MQAHDARVALFVPTLDGGGAERVMVRLARAFACRGKQVDLVLARATGPYLESVPSTVRLIDLGASRVLYSFPRLVRYLRRARPNALLATLAHANVMAVLARRLAARHTRLVVRETIAPLSHARQVQHRRASLVLATTRLYRYADAIVANSKQVVLELSQLLRLPPEAIWLIPNPVVDAELVSLAQQPLEHPWFEDPTVPVVLGVGRLTAQKDFATLLQAVALVNRWMECRLVILGEGEQRSALEHLAVQLGLRDRLWMPGFDPNPYRYMARASVFVLSSRWEGSPNTLIEALACGAPVVATNSPGGACEILEDGIWGMLTPVGDAEALAEAIRCTLHQPPDRDALRRRAQAFSVDQIAERYLEVLGL